MGRVDEAQELWTAAADGLRKAVGPAHTSMASPLGGLGMCELAKGRFNAAEALLTEALALRKVTLARHHWRIAYAENVLGACLAAQSRFAEAEPLLTRSAERLLADRSVPTARQREALERVIGFYIAWDRGERAAMWNARRDDIAMPGWPFAP